MSAQLDAGAAFDTVKWDLDQMIADLLCDPPLSSPHDCNEPSVAYQAAGQGNNHGGDNALPQVAYDWDINNLFAEVPSSAGSSSDASSSNTPESSLADLSCCGQPFSDVFALRSHNETVHKRHHHCTKDRCTKSFTRIFALRRHVKAVHCRTKVVYCPYPDCAFATEGFTRRDIFRMHLKRQHGRERWSMNKRK
jgi:hypothetical protein